MLSCSKCGNEQEEGKFCGKCGSEIVQVEEEATEQIEQTEEQVVEETNQREELEITTEHKSVEVATEAEEQVAVAEVTASNDVAQVGEATGTATGQNDAVESVKESLQAYFEFFKTFVQRPALSIKNDAGHFVNAIVSMVIFAFLSGIIAFILMKNIPYSDVGFFSVFGNVFIIVIVMMVIIISVLFLINKLFGTDYSFKVILNIYGVHVTPVLLLLGIAFLLVLVKSYTYGTLLLTGSFSFITGLIPLYLISSLLTRRAKHIDAFYGYIIYVVAIFIVISTVFSIFIDSTLGSVINQLIPFGVFGGGW